MKTRLPSAGGPLLSVQAAYQLENQSNFQLLRKRLKSRGGSRLGLHGGTTRPGSDFASASLCFSFGLTDRGGSGVQTAGPTGQVAGSTVWLAFTFQNHRRKPAGDPNLSFLNFIISSMVDFQVNPDFYIFYGTQTDTAKFASEELARQAMRRGFTPQVMEFDEYPIMKLPVKKVVVFIIATTGQGEAPQTMQNAWKFLLRSDLPKNSLNQLHFTCFGLGDSQYAQFNAMAKKLSQRLLNLGSQLFHKVGLGDQQHDFGYEGEFDYWAENLWPKLHKITNEGYPPQNKGLLPPVYLVLKVQDSSLFQLETLPTPHGAASKIQLCKALENQKLTSDGHFQDTRKITLDFTADYDAGDIIMVHPANNSQLVTDLLDFLKLNGDSSVLIKADKTQVGQLSPKSLIPFPECEISYRELFTWWINISEPPSRYCCSVLAEWTKQQIFKDKLRYFAGSTADGKSEYFSYCQQEKRNILEVMKDFQISPEKVRLDYFLQIVGRQRVREYSISSFQPGKSVDLTMAVTEYKTKFERQITGVCSGYLKSIEQTYPVPCWLKKGTMDFTEKKPMIFVGPGTGVAAFRSAIQKYVGKTKLVLIFGCRSESDDYYYQEEWKSYGDNLKVITAFSRENQTEGKTYVQHKIRENREFLSKLLLEESARIYVSGRAKFMPASVEKAFVEITSNEHIQAMKKNALYIQEVW